ncbi:MAG: hypothetical protein VST68_09765 [Nitrospirota bacterium]|nr:hypothetical protein [Nitrospirota bacterium]
MPNLKLRVKIADCEYEAEGSQESVCAQFEIFRNLCGTYPQKWNTPDFTSQPEKGPSQNQGTPLPATQPLHPSQFSRNVLERLFIHDPLTSRLSCRVLPTGSTKLADTMLLLLLGNKEILRQQETSALALNLALTRSGGTVARLDRALATYLRDQWVLKSGKGKGGKYRLTKLGIQHAWEKAVHLVNLLPEELNY